MPLPTPPPPSQIPRLLTYYEDEYGVKNEDEQFDRFPDDCEEESDSDDDKEKSQVVSKTGAGSFFRRFRNTSQKNIPRKKADVSFRSQSAIKRPVNSNNLAKSNNSHDGRTQLYRIDPKLKHSVLVVPRKKLTPKKGGVFQSQPAQMTGNTNTTDDVANLVTPQKASMSGAYPTPQSGSMNRDSLVNTLMSGGLGDLDDGFPTLEDGNSLPGNPFRNEEWMNYAMFGSDVQDPVGAPYPHDSQAQSLTSVIQPQSSVQHASEIDGNAFVRVSATNKAQAIDGQPVESPPGSSQAPSAVDDDDGYHADEDEGEQEQEQEQGNPSLQPKHRGRPKNVVRFVEESRDIATPNKGRYVTRGEEQRAKERKKAEKLARRPRTRSTAAFVQAKPSTRSKDTARQATLNKKMKKKGSNRAATIDAGILKRRLVRGTREGRAVKTITNWKGKKLDLKPGQGYMMVDREEEEVDLTEYQRYF